MEARPYIQDIGDARLCAVTQECATDIEACVGTGQTGAHIGVTFPNTELIDISRPRLGYANSTLHHPTHYITNDASVATDEHPSEVYESSATPRYTPKLSISCSRSLSNIFDEEERFSTPGAQLDRVAMPTPRGIRDQALSLLAEQQMRKSPVLAEDCVQILAMATQPEKHSVDPTSFVEVEPLKEMSFRVAAGLPVTFTLSMDARSGANSRVTVLK